MIKGLIFDLDGVIVDTAKFHFIAWKQLANELGFDLTQDQNEMLKGVSRVDSLNQILSWGDVSLSDSEKEKALIKKNNHYLELCDGLSSGDCLPGVIEILAEAAEMGIKLALGSASKNAKLILRKLQIISAFDIIVDGTMTGKGKPDPQVFLKGAEALELEPWQVIVFEDAEKGIEAAINGGFFSVGIGDKAVLGKANMVLDGFEGFHIKTIISEIKA